MVAGMKPIRVIEWNMLNKQKYLGANFASVMGMRIAFHPLQVMQNRISMGDEARAYSGMIDAFRKVVKGEGVGALYTNIGLNLIRSVPIVGEMVIYEELRQVMNDRLGIENTAVKGMVAGMVAGGAVIAVGVPADIIHRIT